MLLGLPLAIRTNDSVEPFLYSPVSVFFLRIGLGLRRLVVACSQV